MQKEYDFSKAEQGKFYRKNVKLVLPIYLDDENYEYVQNLAQKEKRDLNTVVNDLIKTNIPKNRPGE